MMEDGDQSEEDASEEVDP
jgi:hypothetical protein